MATKIKKPKSTDDAKPKPPECDGCLYLKRYYPDMTIEALRPHCGKHPVQEQALKKDGLPPPEPVAPVAERLPDEFRAFVDPWDGSVKTVWASTVAVPPPESSAWEHLIEWSQDVRESHPKLTVNAIALLVRRLMPDDPTAATRLQLIHADELAAERLSSKRLGSPEKKADDGPKPPAPATPPPTPPIPGRSNDAPPKPPAAKKTPQEANGERDAFGYKLGTRASKINAHLIANPGRWFTSVEIETETDTTSAGSHLSSLQAAGWVDYQKAPEGQRGGKYRLKKK